MATGIWFRKHGQKCGKAAEGGGNRADTDATRQRRKRCAYLCTVIGTEALPEETVTSYLIINNQKHWMYGKSSDLFSSRTCRPERT